jgi:hypothetical protein
MDADFVTTFINPICPKIGWIGRGVMLQEFRKPMFIFNDPRDLTPHPWSLSALRGEGAAIGNGQYSFVLRHSYDGVQRTAGPTNFGSWPVSRFEWNR